MGRRSKRRMPEKRTLKVGPKQRNAPGASGTIPELSDSPRGKTKNRSDFAVDVVNESDTKGEKFSVSSELASCTGAGNSFEIVAEIHAEMGKDSDSIETKTNDVGEVKTHESEVLTRLSSEPEEDVAQLEFSRTNKRMKTERSEDMEVQISPYEIVGCSNADNSLKNVSGNEEVVTSRGNYSQGNLTSLSKHVEFAEQVEFFPTDEPIKTAVEEEKGRVTDKLVGRLRMCLKSGEDDGKSLLDRKQEGVSTGRPSGVNTASFGKTIGEVRKNAKEPSGPKLYSCALCPYQSSIPTNFIRLSKNLNGEKPHVCGECCAKFSDKKSFIHDSTARDDDKPYACPHCTARFSVRSTLWMHLKVHVGENAFSCTLCPAVFKERNALFTHLSSCSSQTQFKCSRCDTKFRRKYDLTHHECQNSDDELLSCPKCPLTFRRANLLQMHMSSHIICNLITSYQSQSRSQVDIG